MKKFSKKKKKINEHYISIVEKSSGIKPSSLGDSANPLLDVEIIQVLQSLNCLFNKRCLPNATNENINKIIHSLNSDKAAGPDDILQ